MILESFHGKGETVMKKLLSSISRLAIIFSWAKIQRNHHEDKIMDNWVERYFPSNLFYIRPLTPLERSYIGNKYDGEKDLVWYSICDPLTGQPLAVSDDIRVIIKEARNKGLIPVLRH